jgi:hypothetical protein
MIDTGVLFRRIHEMEAEIERLRAVLKDGWSTLALGAVTGGP